MYVSMLKKGLIEKIEFEDAGKKDKVFCDRVIIVKIR